MKRAPRLIKSAAARKSAPGPAQSCRFKLGHNSNDVILELVADVEQVFKAKNRTLLRMVDSSHLSERVRNQLTKVKSEWDGCTNESIDSAVKTGMLQGCALKVEHGTNDVFTLVATKKLEEGECIGVLTGELWTARDFDKIEENYNDCTFDFAKHLIGEHYIGENIVLYYKNSNELSFLQDSSWCGLLNDDTREDPNTQMVAYWSHEENIPLIACVTTRSVNQGDELFTYWGDNVWESLSKEALNKQSYISHQLHLYYMKLSSMVTLDFDHGLSSTIQFDRRNIQYNVSFLENDVEDTTIISPVAPPTTAFILPANQSLPFEKSDCEYDNEMDISIQQTTRDHLRQFFIKEGNSWLLISENKKLKNLLDLGTCPKCEIKEVMGLHHPARWCSPPHFTAFALTAKEKIKKNEFIGFYIGVLTEENNITPSADQVYMYTVDLGPGYKGPALIIQNKDRGNESRYVNDCWNREQEKATVNVHAVQVWDDAEHVPLIAFQATKQISKGDELVVSYGPHFWRAAAKYLMLEQASYAEKMMRHVANLEEECESQLLELPKKPKMQDLQLMCIFQNGEDLYKDF